MEAGAKRYRDLKIPISPSLPPAPISRQNERMTKKTMIVLSGVVVVSLIAYIGLSFFLGSIVKAGVSTFAPKLTQTTVELSGARISPLTGSGTLSGLAVGNPKGWSDRNAFYLGKIHVEVQPFSIFGNHIVIEEIMIDQPEFVYETKIVSSNIKDLLNNIEAFTNNGRAEAKPVTEGGEPIKFIVKKFRLTNGTAKLGAGPAAIPVPLPTISLDDLGVKENGITPDQLAGAVMKSVLGDIVSATGKAALKAGGTIGAGAANTAGDAVKKTGEGIKKLFGK